MRLNCEHAIASTAIARAVETPGFEEPHGFLTFSRIALSTTHAAYNIFFKEERQRILKGIPDEEDKKKPAKSTTDDAADDKDGGKRKKSPHGKIGFESLAKMIGQRWQDLPPKEVNYYKEKAKTDMDRYKTEMEAYLSKQSKVAAAAALAGGDNDEQDDSDIR